jgi:hypothetical protein
MSLARLPSWAYTLLAILPPVALAIAPMPADPAIRLALGVACLLWIVALGIYAWIRLDETGKEAHKFAWFWGGTAALVVAQLLAVGSLVTPVLAEPVGAMVANYTKDGQTAQTGFTLGVYAAAVIQIIGYGLVWAVWWLSARMNR